MKIQSILVNLQARCSNLGLIDLMSFIYQESFDWWGTQSLLNKINNQNTRSYTEYSTSLIIGFSFFDCCCLFVYNFSSMIYIRIHYDWKHSWIQTLLKKSIWKSLHLLSLLCWLSFIHHLYSLVKILNTYSSLNLYNKTLRISKTTSL